MKKPELLAPAGSLERLETAVLFGADAVYAGGEAFSMRTAAKNFTSDELKKAREITQKKGCKLYIATNIIPHNSDMEALPAFLEEMADLSPDGLIVADLGVFSMAKKLAPGIPIHISTQANNTNAESFSAWHALGASRVVAARELSLSEIKEIKQKIPKDLEIEAFVHGAMCISYSGRCLLSGYMAGRDSNRGNCAHPCRWNYSLVEEQRPGEYYPVFEGERGTFLFNSKDLCMIEHVPELIESGVDSFKIEGRVKTEYYVATVVKAYREAIDRYCESPSSYQFNPAWREEIEKVSNRRYTTGFYMGRPDESAQVYESSSYVRTYEVAAVVTGYDEVTGDTLIEQRNRFFEGDTLEILAPHTQSISFTVNNLRDFEGNPVESAPHPKQVLRLQLPERVPAMSLLRRMRSDV
ncbi:MAG: U32 family peptidase [Ruminococcaceae bacterium]|nr:U32 family peptidase [Oscillospiraceae bacterium]